MSSLEVGKIGQWDEHNLKKALRHLPAEIDDVARSLIKQLLHYDPDERFTNMRQVLEHPYFSSAKTDRPQTMMPVNNLANIREGSVQQQFSTKFMEIPQATATQSLSSSSSPSTGGASFTSRSKTGLSRSTQLDYVDENSINGTTSRSHNMSSKLNDSVDVSSVVSSQSKRSRKFGSIRNPFGKSRKQSLKK